MNKAITSHKRMAISERKWTLLTAPEGEPGAALGADSSGEGSGAGEGIRSESQKSQSGILIFIFGRKKSLP